MLQPATTSPHTALRRAFALALVLTLSLAGTAAAQTVVEPAAPFTAGSISSIIVGDTTATGERTECHYILRRGAVYVYDRKMDLEGDCTWIIEAEEGDGPRPIIRPAALQGAEEAPRQFHIFSNTSVYLRDLWLDGYDTSVPEPGRPSDNAQVRVSVDSARVFIDNVRFDRNRQSAIRSDNAQTSFYVTNSEFTNIYNANRPDQGYVIDTRGNQLDTVSFVNTSFWNIAGQITRDADDARINYYRMDHNTFVNLGGIPSGSFRLDTLRSELPGEQDFGVISLAQAEFAVFRNNLLVNPGIFGTEDSDVFVPRYVVDVDSMLIEIDSVTFDVAVPQGVDIRNNVIGFDPDLATSFPDTIRGFGNVDFYDPTLDLFIAAKGSEPTLLETLVDLEDAPTPPFDILVTYFEIVGGQREAEQIFFPRDTRNVQDPEGDIDLSYPQTSPAYTAGTGGMPVGDLNWFGMADAYTSGPDEFATPGELGTPVEAGADVPDGFRLHGNFPNPFNPSTTIRFDLDASADVAVRVYDLLGREVMALPAQPFATGSGHAIRLEASTLASGVYFYRVEAQGLTQTQVKAGRMVLLK